MVIVFVKFAVTGAAGFIGSHISKFLIDNDHEVVAIDNLERGSLENLSEIQNQISFQQTDILDYQNLEKALKNVDGVFHEAALGSVPQSFKDPEKYFQVNAIGTENIFKIAQKNNIKVVYASSSSVYGNQKTFPIKESAPKNPLNPYGKSKLQAEEFAQKYSKSGVKIIGLRYFNVFGIGQNPNYSGVIPKFIEQLINKKSPIIEGDGNQVRNFTFINDIVEANYLAFKSDVDFAFLNIAAGKTVSINELSKIMINLSGLDLEPEYVSKREGDIKISQADISEAKKLLNWFPKVSLEEGLKKIFPSMNN